MTVEAGPGTVEVTVEAAPETVWVTVLSTVEVLVWVMVFVPDAVDTLVLVTV